MEERKQASKARGQRPVEAPTILYTLRDLREGRTRLSKEKPFRVNEPFSVLLLRKYNVGSLCLHNHDEGKDDEDGKVRLNCGGSLSLSLPVIPSRR